jgi:hypothetical protein
MSFGLELSQVSTLNGQRPTGVYHFSPAKRFVAKCFVRST